MPSCRAQLVAKACESRDKQEGQSLPPLQTYYWDILACMQRGMTKSRLHFRTSHRNNGSQYQQELLLS